MIELKSTNSVANGFRKIAGLLAPIAISLITLGCSDQPEAASSGDLAGKSRSTAMSRSARRPRS